MPKKIWLENVGEIYADTRVDVSVDCEDGSYMLFSNARIHYEHSVVQLMIDAGNCFTNGCAGIRLKSSEEMEPVDYYEDTKFCNIKFNNGMPTISIKPTEVEKYRGYPDDWISPEEREIVACPVEKKEV
ncbi:MAG: hypothetical protein LUD12_12280 [Lachnospiraceae bacterium]|nr:hypothetical protein [Lachnospiraceae bacterium]